MTVTESNQAQDAEDTIPGPARMRPNQIAILVGIAIGLVVALSGVAATVFQFHDESAVQREVFDNIPGPLKLAFYTIIPMMFVYGAVMFSYRVRNWERGGPDKRDITPKNAKARMGRLRAGLYMQTLLRDPAAGIMHSMIYFGFLVLLAVTSVLEINHQLPESLKFLHGTVYEGYAFIGDLAGSVPRRNHLGDSSPLCATAIPHPHQVQPGARNHSGHALCNWCDGLSR